MSILIYFATIFWSLFPNLIHVFQGGENQVIKVNETNLVVNGDLTMAKPSPNENQPLGFNYVLSSNITLVGGIAKFTATAQYGSLRYTTLTSNIGDIIYVYSKYKSDVSVVRLEVPSKFTNHIGNNQFEFISTTFTSLAATSSIFISDHRTSGWTPIEVDYIGAFNVSQMMLNGVKDNNGVLFTDLSNEEIRLQLDKWISDTDGSQLVLKIDNTYDKWFNTGFVEKTAERDFLDYLGYFFWLTTPPIILFATLDLIRRVI